GCAAVAVTGALDTAETKTADEPYLALRAFWSASIAADRGTTVRPSTLAPAAASASAKTSPPSSGPSLTPATTARSSIGFGPCGVGPSESIVAAMAFRPAPIWVSRSTTRPAAFAAAGAHIRPND